MRTRRLHRSNCFLRCWIGGTALAIVMGLAARTNLAYTPDSPEVLRICEKAVKFLETDAGDEYFAKQLGGQSMVALAIHKYYKHIGGRYAKTLHPKVRAALERCRREAPNLRGLGENRTYHLGTSIIFLSEVSPADDYGTLQAFVNELLWAQLPNGSWGYKPPGQTGDISQTQYGVLGLWSAANVGVNTGVAPMERVALFLARVQDPSGGWGYQARDPGQLGRRTAQDAVTNSRTAAGLSSLYVAADYLGFSKATDGDDKDKDSLEYIELPPVFIPVIEEDPELAKKRKRKRIRYRSKIGFSPLQAAMNDGNAWIKKRFKYEVEGWQYYYIYGLERYFSFKEFMTADFQKEPAWYNNGVDFLARKQGPNGSFRAPSASENCGPYVDTAFAVLFLLRSTRDTIQRVTNSSGALEGGYGLPDDVSEIRLTSDNKIQAPKVTMDVDEIMNMLDGDDVDSQKFDDIVSNPDAYAITEMDPKKSADYTERMRRVLRSGTWQARIIAARLLGRQGDLDNVPILIYALTDPDPRVVREAWKGLRLTRRRLFDAGKPPDPRNQAEVEQAVAEWKQWYRSIRPDAAFIEPNVAAASGGRQSGSSGPSGG